LYDFDPAEEDEIPLSSGSVVFIFHQDRSGWWIGECEGKYGIFPGKVVTNNFVLT
jgi:signal transducing adaptor molecule